jgi:DNA repair protein REV1
MLTGKPVVVAHSNSAHGTSSVASASYEARKFGTYAMIQRTARYRRCGLPLLSTLTGVSNGMMVGQARELCPDLVAVPYDFDKYEKVRRPCTCENGTAQGPS